MESQRYKSIGKIRTKVTYLTMEALPEGLYVPEVEEGINIRKEEKIAISLYRELYHKVGETLMWTGRKLLSDEELSLRIHGRGVSIFVLREGELPIGFIEFEKNFVTDEVEIGLFGIIPEYYGKKLGIYLLNWGIKYCWEVLKCRRLWLHTCDLDHVQALGVYLKSGFRIEKEQDEFVDEIMPVSAE